MASIGTFSHNALLIIAILLFYASNVNNKRLCGRELADTLKAICKNNYNGYGRLIAPLASGYPAEIEPQSAYDYQSIPFISKLTGGILSPKVKRRKRGVSDECCKKACTYRELTNYCFEPQS